MACLDMNAEIDNKAVYVKQWSATEGLNNLSNVLSMFGGDILPFIEGNFILGDIVALLQKEKAGVVDLIKKITISARIEGKEITFPTFDKEYNGELMFIFKVFSFVCKTQFEDFFKQGSSLKDSHPEET